MLLSSYVILITKQFSYRAKLHGWPNTYVFTKAMGEMLIGSSRENLPLVIIRPTMITSTLAEPFPGWIERLRCEPVNIIILFFNINQMSMSRVIYNVLTQDSYLIIFTMTFRTIDSVIVAYGKGRLKCFLADSTSVFDLVSTNLSMTRHLIQFIAY